MLRHRIEAGDFPSAVYLVAEHGRVRFAEALGEAVREPESYLAKLETIYDLASLTKPLVTGLLCARLVGLGELTIDSSIGQYLPEFDRPDKNQITIRELLTHTSGLRRGGRCISLPTTAMPRWRRSRMSRLSTNRALALFTAIQVLLSSAFYCKN